MERRFLTALGDHGSGVGAFAMKWEGWKNPTKRGLANVTNGRINVSHADDMDRIDDQMGVYSVLYQPSAGSRYVVYVGYSKRVSNELKIRYGGWEADGRIPGSRSRFPFAVLYLSNQRVARAYEDDLIRFYAPPWNTKFHR